VSQCIWAASERIQLGLCFWAAIEKIDLEQCIRAASERVRWAVGAGQASGDGKGRGGGFWTVWLLRALPQDPQDLFQQKPSKGTPPFPCPPETHVGSN
jgi:hypothetical protein